VRARDKSKEMTHNLPVGELLQWEIALIEAPVPLLCQKPTSRHKGRVFWSPEFIYKEQQASRFPLAAQLSFVRARLMRALGDEIVLLPSLVQHNGRYFLRLENLCSHLTAVPRFRQVTLKTHSQQEVRIVERRSTQVVQLNSVPSAKLSDSHIADVYWHLICRFVCSVADSGRWNILAELDEFENVRRLGGVDLEEQRDPGRTPNCFWECLCVERGGPLRRLGEQRAEESWRPVLLARAQIARHALTEGRLDSIAQAYSFEFNTRESLERLELVMGFLRAL
jgi:hypothetical protein